MTPSKSYSRILSAIDFSTLAFTRSIEDTFETRFRTVSAEIFNSFDNTSITLSGLVI